LGLAGERFVVAFLGTAANVTWDRLEPYVIREREIRGDGEILAFFEDFVCRIRENHPLEKAYGLELKKIVRGSREESSVNLPSPDRPSPGPN
jgi:hypothetical protein